MLSALRPYKDILLFVVCLLGANCVWKGCIAGDEELNTVTLLGHDITCIFSSMASHIAQRAAAICGLVTDSVHYVAPYSIRFDSGFGTRIVWSCTPVKQAFIWLIIMLFASGKWQHKLWYIPAGALFIWCFNILRIALIDLLCEHHPDMFVFWHVYFFKYLFYGMIFLLWLLWIEKIGKRA